MTAMRAGANLTMSKRHEQRERRKGLRRDYRGPRYVVASGQDFAVASFRADVRTVWHVLDKATGRQHGEGYFDRSLAEKRAGELNAHDG